MNKYLRNALIGAGMGAITIGFGFFIGVFDLLFAFIFSKPSPGFGFPTIFTGVFIGIIFGAIGGWLGGLARSSRFMRLMPAAGGVLGSAIGIVLVLLFFGALVAVVVTAFILVFIVAGS